MDTELQCSICLKEFDKTKNLMRHLKLHSNIKSYKCTYQDCSMSYSRSDHLKRHLISHSQNPKPFKCTSCIMRFSNKSHLNRHLKLHADPESNRQSSKKMRKTQKNGNINKESSSFVKSCFFPYCDFKSSNQRRFIHHINHKHNRTKILSSKVCFSNKRNSLNQRYKHLISSNKLNNQMFKCEIDNCGKIYSSKYNLSIHVKSFHLNNGFQCEYFNCQMMFRHKCSLKKHIMNVHSKAINSIDNNDNKEECLFNKDVNENNNIIINDQATEYKSFVLNNENQSNQLSPGIIEDNEFDSEVANSNIFFDRFGIIENRYLLEQLDN